MRTVLMTLLGLAAGASFAQAPLRVEDARIGWVPRWVPHPGFVELTNEGDEPVTLTGARSDGFARIEFKAPEDGGLFMNEPLPMPVGIEPGDTLALEPGGAYMMLMTQSSWLEPGEQVTIELLFRERPPLPIVFTVRKMGQ